MYPPATDKLPQTGPFKKRRILQRAVNEYEKEHGPGSATEYRSAGSFSFAAAAAARQQQQQQPAAGSRLVDGLTPANIVQYLASSLRLTPPGVAAATAAGGGGERTTLAMPRRTPLGFKW